MRRSRTIGMVLALVFFATSLCAAEPAKVGPWVKFDEGDRMVGYVRDNSRVVLKEGLCVGIIDSSAQNIENMMRTWDAYLKVLFLSKKAQPASGSFCTPSPDVYCAYLLQGAPWPVGDRDGYGTLRFFIDKKTGETLVKVEVDKNDMPETPGIVRLPFCEMEWMIKPIDENRCLVFYQMMMLPGGAIGNNIPKPVINWGMRNYGSMTFKNIRKLAKEDKYKHSKGYITQTQWPSELRYYMEDALKLPEVQKLLASAKAK